MTNEMKIKVIGPNGIEMRKPCGHIGYKGQLCAVCNGTKNIDDSNTESAYAGFTNTEMYCVNLEKGLNKYEGIVKATLKEGNDGEYGLEVCDLMKGTEMDFKHTDKELKELYDKFIKFDGDKLKLLMTKGKSIYKFLSDDVYRAKYYDAPSQRMKFTKSDALSRKVLYIKRGVYTLLGLASAIASVVILVKNF